jgi:HD-like signal output (HDOD) protein
VGALALRHCRPQAWELCRRSGSLELERQSCGADHAAVGAYLLGLWGLPGKVVQAVAGHHQAPQNGDPLQAALARAEASFSPSTRSAMGAQRIPASIELEVRP